MAVFGNQPDPWAPCPPIIHLRAAMLVALLTLVALSPLFGVLRPPPLHQIMIELREDAERGPSDGPYYRLEIAPDRTMVLDGRPQDTLIDLRMQLDLLTLDPEAGLELRPHPEARYEDFLEVLAVVRRVNFRRLRVVGDGWVAPAVTAANARWVSADPRP
jgi:hypothetical protein